MIPTGRVENASIDVSANYDITFATANVGTITPKALNVSASGGGKVYDGTALVGATFGLSDDRVSGDVLILTYTASFGDKNVGTGKTITVTDIALAGADGGNYTPNTSNTTTADITPRPLTVTGTTGGGKVYDGTTAVGPGFALTDSRISGDVVTLSFTAVFASKNVATPQTINVTAIAIGGGVDAGNYTLANTSVNGPANITMRPITVTADAKSKVFGAVDPPLTYQLTGGNLVAPDTLTGALARTAGESVGTYSINQNTLTAGSNYNLTYIGASLTIGAWTAQGFYEPIGMSNSVFVPAGSGVLAPAAPTGTMVWNSAKGGSTVPLKFNAFAGSIEKTSVASIRSFTARRLSGCTGSTFDDPVELESTGATTLRYDGVPGAGGQFIQNWKTARVSSDECYRVELTFQDASVLYTFITLKR
jgi:hypothetical protein